MLSYMCKDPAFWNPRMFIVYEKLLLVSELSMVTNFHLSLKDKESSFVGFFLKHLFITRNALMMINAFPACFETKFSSSYQTFRNILFGMVSPLKLYKRTESNNLVVAFNSTISGNFSKGSTGTRIRT